MDFVYKESFVQLVLGTGVGDSETNLESDLIWFQA